MACRVRVAVVVGNVVNNVFWGIKSQKSSKFLSARSVFSQNLKQITTAGAGGPNRKKLGIFGKAVLLGTAIGGAYGYYSYDQRKRILAKPASGEGFFHSVPPPKPSVSRRVSIPDDFTGLRLTLYQYQTCPFCCKVRTFLDYYGISYDLVEVNPVLRKEMEWSSYKKVPVVVANIAEGYQQLNDSSMVISALFSYLWDSSRSVTDLVAYYPPLTAADADGKTRTDIMNKYSLMYGDRHTRRTKDDISSERTWRRWVDDVLVHTLSPNVYRTPAEAVRTFQWFAEAGDWRRLFADWERLLVVYVGAAAMYAIGKMLKRKYKLKDDVRESLYDACTAWTRELDQRGTPFLGGAQPNLADLAVYGVLSSIEGCQAFTDLLEHTDIGGWFYRTKSAVASHQGGGKPVV